VSPVNVARALTVMVPAVGKVIAPLYKDELVVGVEPSMV
jgi:hypothetical protein